MIKYFFLLICLIACTENGQNSSIFPEQLTCEYFKNPSVIDVATPRLSWINIAKTGIRGQAQTARQVKVATSEVKLAQPDLWDSKKVLSNESNRIKYNGKTLISRQECWWQVRVWDNKGIASGWSAPAMWRMGILKNNEWKAKWIGAPWQDEKALPKPAGGPNEKPDKFGPPAPLLRKVFQINKEVTKAVAYVTGLGYFELYVNGKKIGDDVLVPNQTNYGKRPQLPEALINLEDNFREYKVMYLAYDITNRLDQGKNVIGSILGNGFYNPAKFWTAGYGSPRFLSQVHITYSDGTEEIIVSDESWKASKSAIVMDMVYYGEHYDARNEQPGWCTSTFDDTNWKNVVLRKAPEGKLVAHTAHPDRITERITPVSIEPLENGKYKVDFGVEISGWLRINNAEAPAGHKIDINYISNQYSGDNSYIFRGDGPESYSARFNWFVFSGVEISNWHGELKASHLTAEAVNTFIEESAEFETSNPLLNNINKIWKRSQIDNMHGGIASDCPHRERSGYTGDGQVACVTVMHNYDAKNFYHKWVKDMFEAQNVETGYVPNGAPWEPGCGGGVGWGAAICIIPWEFYLHYGAVDMLEDNYEGMKGYVRYMQNWVDDEGVMFSQRTAKDGKPLKWFNLGEWVAPGETVSDAMVHTFYFWRCADLTARTAKILLHDQEAQKYADLAEETKKAFHARFYDAEKASYGNGGGNIFALKMGVPQDQYGKVVAALKTNIKTNKGHLDTGIFGTQFFFEVLSEHGMHELAYEAMNKKTEPSYGHWLELGATTTREQWSEEGSHNHPMFGGGLVWLYRKLAGMRADPTQPGYRHIIFQPQFVDEMDFVTYSNNTPYGKAGISWKHEEDKYIMDITVPVGTNATIYVPTDDINKLKEGSTNINQSKEIQIKSTDSKQVVLNVGSGSYHFQF